MTSSNSNCSSVSETPYQLEQQIMQKKKQQQQQHPQTSNTTKSAEGPPSMKSKRFRQHQQEEEEEKEENQCGTQPMSKENTSNSMKKKKNAETTSSTKEKEKEMVTPSPRRTRSDNNSNKRRMGGVRNKKAWQTWSSEEEIVLLREMLARSRGKLEWRGVYEQARSCLKGKYSRQQLYNKMHWLKDKFHATNVEKKKNKSFQFKNTHDESLYGLSKELWGSEDKKKMAKETEGHNKMPQNEEEKEEEHQEEEEEVEKEEEAGGNENEGGGGGGEEAEAKEKLGVSPDLRDDLIKVVKDVLERCLSSRAGNTFDVTVESLCKDILNKGCSSRDLPPLRDSHAELLERMWQRQHVLELQTCGKRLDLLKEECQMRLEELGSCDKN